MIYISAFYFTVWPPDFQSNRNGHRNYFCCASNFNVSLSFKTVRNRLKASIGDEYRYKWCGAETWHWGSSHLHFLFLCRRDPFRAHREHMRQMMRSFSEPFGGPLMPTIMDGRRRSCDMEGHTSSSRALRENHRVRTCVSRSTPLIISLLLQSRSWEQITSLHIYTNLHICIVWFSVRWRIRSHS